MACNTLSPHNQLRVTCPVFGVESRIAVCFALRDAVWRGERVSARQGCQCAMVADKCPIPNVVKRMCRDNSDPYFAASDAVGQFDDYDIAKVAPVLVMEATMSRFALSPAEQTALISANAKARSIDWSSVRSVDRPKASGKTPKKRGVMHEATKSAPESDVAKNDTDAIVEAATTGNLAAAINAAA